MSLRRAAISVLSVLLLAPAIALVSAAPSDAVGGRFVTTWNTSIRHTVSLHMYGSVDVTVAWGDGTQSTVSGERAPDTTGPVKHTYAQDVDQAEVVVTGTFERFGNYPVDYDWPDYTSPPWGLRTVEEWGPTGTTDLSGAFADAVYLTKVAEIPSGVTDMSYMLYRALDFNQPVVDWDISEVTDMSGMFQESGFNQPLAGWDVSGVTDMSALFAESPFNQPIGGWDTSQVTDMSYMFGDTGDTGAFNQPLGNWDVSRVTDMTAMFAGTPFNRPLRDWDVSNVTSMSGMFQGVNEGGWSSPTAFNRSLAGWDVSNVESMSMMFARSSFNRPLGSWDTSSVQSTAGMFLYSPFNQPIGDWDVSNVEGMRWMFSGSPFNRPIGDWDVSNVQDMHQMFGGTPFNRPIGGWDVSGVARSSNMARMFEYAKAFNQDLSDWCVPTIRKAPYQFDLGATSWTRDRPHWGTCGGGGAAPPTAQFDLVSGTDGVLRVRGTATDDLGVESVAIGVRDAATGEWLRRDGTWGAFQKLWTKLDSPGATSTTWSTHLSLAKGTYGVTLIVKDTSGQQNAEPRPWRTVEVT